MPLELIIDGYNLIRQSDTFRRLDARSLEQGREALLQRLVEYKKVRGHPITVVFDGWGSFNPFSTDTHHKGISVVYTGKGELADDYIKRTVAKIQYGAVVTSDQEVKRYAERQGVPAIASDLFESKMNAAISGQGDEIDIDEDEWEEEELVEAKKKGTAWRLSKQEKRRQAILKKL
jgi:predicted RNA-binding protein with PIN domain